MNKSAKIVVGLVIAFYMLAFIAEAILWMSPTLHGAVIPKLNPELRIDVSQQAIVLRTLLVNQGFYNLFLAIGGLSGLVLINRGQRSAGLALVFYSCAFATCAGLVLLATTSAYTGGLLQAGLGATALLLTYRSAASSHSAQAEG